MPSKTHYFAKIFWGAAPPPPPLARQLCIIVMSDYYCPTNFFNAKCRLKHIISQKCSGGLRPSSPLTEELFHWPEKIDL